MGSIPVLYIDEQEQAVTPLLLQHGRERSLRHQLHELFDENIAAKIIEIAERQLENNVRTPVQRHRGTGLLSADTQIILRLTPSLFAGPPNKLSTPCATTRRGRRPLSVQAY